MKITDQQILAAFKKPETLKELFPDVFKPKFIAGNWYRCPISKLLIKLVNFKDIENCTAYGFDVKGTYYKQSPGWTMHNLIPADDLYVAQRLFAEAEKKGYESKSYDYNTDIMTVNGKIIFNDGVWIQKTVLTRQEIAYKFGIDINDLEIKE